MPDHPPPTATIGVLAEVAAERARQDVKWGEQNHALGTSPDHRVLGRSFGELAAAWKAACQQEASERQVPHLGPGGELVWETLPPRPLWSLVALEEVGEFLVETDPARARAEALQAAAVFVAIVECINRASRQPAAIADPRVRPCGDAGDHRGHEHTLPDSPDIARWCKGTLAAYMTPAGDVDAAAVTG